MADKNDKKGREGIIPGSMRSFNLMSQGGGITLPETNGENDRSEDDKCTNKQTDSQWKDFLAYAQEYKETKAPSVQVWLDSDVNYTLDAIRQAGVKIPVKHLLSAAVRVFLETNADEIRALMDKKPKMII